MQQSQLQFYINKFIRKIESEHASIMNAWGCVEILL